jgi:glycosyltransferase involved in cell wall biosynthesis
VTPFHASPIIATPLLAVRRLIELLNTEAGVWWYRNGHSRLLRRLLRCHLKDGKPAIIYTQCPLSAWAALESRQGPWQRVLMAVHFNESQALEWCGKGKIAANGRLFNVIREQERQILPRLDGIVYVSRYMKNCLERDIPALSSVKSIVVPNFCDPPSSVKREPVGDLVSVGTLEPRKNQRFLLEVLASARRHGRSYRLSLIGNGPDRRFLEETARKLGVNDQIRFLGYQKKVIELLPGYRMYVHAAQQENLPMAIIEALASGIPVAASPVGGIPEMFDDDIEGIYWSHNDPEKASLRMIKVLEHPGVHNRMRMAAFQRFEREFSSDLVGGRLKAFLTDW